MCIIPQLVSAPLNLKPIIENSWGATQNVSTVTDKMYEYEKQHKENVLPK